MKKIKQFGEDEKGVSEVIGAILILTIMVAFLGVQQVYSLPVWNKEIEFAHFNTIFDDVLELKRMIQETAVYDFPRTAVIHTSLDYPTRLFLLNPGKPSATITTKSDKPLKITYDGNVTEQINSCTIMIEEHYNYFDAPTIVMEHGMIIGREDNSSYIIDNPPLTLNNMDLLIVNCENTSQGTTSSLNIQMYPLFLKTVTVSNASLSFHTDYPELWRKYLISINSDFSISGNTAILNYNNITKIRTMRGNIGPPSNLTIIPVTTTPVINPAPFIIDSFETVGDKGYSSSGSNDYSQNSNSSYVSHQTGSLQLDYDFTSKQINEWLTVDINYNRYTPQKSYNVSGYPYMKLDIYGDASNYSIVISIRGGSKTYEYAPVILNWSGWKTVILPLSLAGGVDLNAVDSVTFKIMEENVPGNRGGKIYFDFLRGTY